MQCPIYFCKLNLISESGFISINVNKRTVIKKKKLKKKPVLPRASCASGKHMSI